MDVPTSEWSGVGKREYQKRARKLMAERLALMDAAPPASHVMAVADYPRPDYEPEPTGAAIVALRAKCVCGHEMATHEHYRRGVECSLCDCPNYKLNRKPR